MADLNMGVPKHRAFVDALINDEGLRAKFASDPTAVLHAHGIGYKPGAKHTTGTPPSADALRAARAHIVKKLDDSGGWDSMDPAGWDSSVGWDSNNQA